MHCSVSHDQLECVGFMEPVKLELNQSNSRSLYASFNRAYKTDCVYHHEVLREITSQADVRVVAECGVYQGWSTALFMTCDIDSLYSYEVDFQHVAPLILAFMQAKGDISWSLYSHNTIADPIAPADLVFLDTVHTYEFVQQEIALQAPHAAKYIAVHDANYPNEPTPKKVRDAVTEYANNSNGVWKIDLDSSHGTGIIVLKRQKLLGCLE